MKNYNLTQHAQIRKQQRAIPSLVVDWLLSYGRRDASHGAIKVYFDKPARKQLSGEVGKQAVSHLSKYMNAAIVIDGVTEKVITIEWLH